MSGEALTIYATALAWLDRGRSLVPLQPGSKRIVRTFGPVQQSITDYGGAYAWWGLRRCNLGLVTGDGLTVLDFDDVANFWAWREKFPEISHTYTVKTRRGFHVYLAGDVLPAADADGLPAAVPGAEVKGAGALVVAAPSVVAGFTYLPLDWGADILHVPATLSLLSEGGSLSKESAPAPIPGDDTISRVKAAWPILAYAKTLTKLSSRDGRWYHGLCPLHSEKNPSFWLDVQRGLWGCYGCHHRGDVVNLFAQVEGLNVSDAIKRMVEARCG